MRTYLILVVVIFLTGCLGIPEGVSPVNDFDINRYLGKWYEIARLDHSFERGLNNVSAEYSLREDGGINVLNRGYSIEDKEWNSAEGRADPGTGYLKVSFFRPFYGSYIVFDLDIESYQYAFVCGPDKSYLWLLSRTKTVKKKLIDQFVKKSGEIGFETENLIFVEHE
jgi:apolipoprotein D and lipocalin family protein